MDGLLDAVLTGLIVGAGGTAGGACIALLLRATNRRLCAALMGISGGIMLSAVFFDMLPHSLEHAVWYVVLAGAALGALAMFIVTKLVPHIDADEYDEAVIHDIKSKRLARSGVLLALGIAIHNLPQGIALGGGVGHSAALTLALLLLLHNIPEGMAMAIPLKVGGVKRGKIIFIALMAALPTVVGAMIGAAMSAVSELFIGASIAFAAGAMLYLTLKELIPQAFGMEKSVATLVFLIVGAAAGGVVVWLTHAH